MTWTAGLGSPAPAPQAQQVAATFDLNHSAGEPTLGVTKDGALFYAALSYQGDIAGQATTFPQTDILRSVDGGHTWKDVSPRLPVGALPSHQETADPFVYVDPATSRVFDVDQRLFIGCHQVAYSDDKGATWAADTPACPVPLVDHQSIIAAKPRMLPASPVYPDFLYMCINQLEAVTCERSTDGGLTWQEAGNVGGPDGAAPSDATNGPAPCGSLPGHLRSSPDGIVYMPKRECARPFLAMSQDDGLTWQWVQVSKRAELNDGGLGMDPTAAIDSKGNVYYVFQATDGHLYLARSLDKGKTWLPEIDVTRPGGTAGQLAQLAADGEGRIALAYIATNATGGLNATNKPDSTATWDAFLVTSTNAAGPDPTFTATRIDPAPHPVLQGSCGPSKCQGFLDFIDVKIDHAGRPWVAFLDDWADSSAHAAPGSPHLRSRATVATLAAGASLADGGGAL